MEEVNTLVRITDDPAPTKEDIELERYELPDHGWYDHYFLQEDDGEIE